MLVLDIYCLHLKGTFSSLMQVSFFQQGTLPCISKDGRFIMETPYRVGVSFSVIHELFSFGGTSFLFFDLNTMIFLFPSNFFYCTFELVLPKERVNTEIAAFDSVFFYH